MIAVIDNNNTLIYIGNSIELLPSSLLEQDMFGRKSIYRHIQVSERPKGMMLVWNDNLGVFEDTLKLSPDPSTDIASLIKENENLKEQLKLIKTHLGL